ncbi:hypothetical protein GcC1_222017 [Golovinomyces cichoracearum]|uniref:Zn(2)-C6 fungal-type domain-containing protein n=1 Tax=Golovinomyces cichoracearum TaxID=62708 RepID=A0A420H7F6_9PEZI|nr:hypothetical protein GcC1_222017 [Golovinomyces cichoracearum]
MAPKITLSPSISNDSRVSTRPAKRQRSFCLNDEDSDDVPRKQHRRVSKACERCRLKKTKCDGEIPCQRCTDDMVACCEGARKKGGSKTVSESSCVELLECQQSKFIAGHLKMFKLMVDAGIWSFGEVRRNSRGVPIVHDILEKLGVMRSGSDFSKNFPESPDENRALREQLKAKKHRETSTDDGDKFQLTTPKSSPPLLEHTDRESSMETCFSEVKPTILTESRTMNMGQPSYPNIELQQNLDRYSSRNFYWRSNGEKMDTNMAQHNLMPSVANSLLENYQLQDKEKKSINSNPWEEPVSNFLISIPSSAQDQPQYPMYNLGTYGILFNSSTAFNDVPNLGSSQFLQSLDTHIGMMPSGMKYAYDPYMG